MNSRVACLLAATLLASACATTRAATPVERPALEVPPVPPRIIEPAPPPETSESRAGQRSAAGEARDADRRARAAVSARPVARHPEAAPTPKPAETPPRAGRAAAPAATEHATAPPIRTPATADAAAAETPDPGDAAPELSSRLNIIDYQRLSDAQKAYNEAKDFIERAEAAIKASNFELAKGLASTAEKLANELPNR